MNGQGTTTIFDAAFHVVGERGDSPAAQWHRAAADATSAYAHWRRNRDAASYAAYRAAADQADAAQDALARAA
jgi:hypothetical protein